MSSLRPSIALFIAALAVGCGGSDTKSATADEAELSYGLILTHLDYAFGEAHQHATGTTTTGGHEDFAYSGNCVDGGTLDVTGSVDETQGNDGTFAFTYTQNVTFSGCFVAQISLDGPVTQTETFTESGDSTSLAEVFDVQLTFDAVDVLVHDDSGATGDRSFTCGSTALTTSTTVTETSNGAAQVPTRTQSVDGSGTLCERPWDNDWGTTYQFSAL